MDFHAHYSLADYGIVTRIEQRNVEGVIPHVPDQRLVRPAPLLIQAVPRLVEFNGDPNVLEHRLYQGTPTNIVLSIPHLDHISFESKSKLNRPVLRSSSKQNYP